MIKYFFKIKACICLAYSNRDWSVVNVWNSEQLKKNRSQIHRQLVQHLIDQNYDQGTLYELMTIITKVTFCQYVKWFNILLSLL